MKNNTATETVNNEPETTIPLADIVAPVSSKEIARRQYWSLWRSAANTGSISPADSKRLTELASTLDISAVEFDRHRQAAARLPALRQKAARSLAATGDMVVAEEALRKLLDEWEAINQSYPPRIEKARNEMYHALSVVQNDGALELNSILREFPQLSTQPIEESVAPISDARLDGLRVWSQSRLAEIFPDGRDNNSRLFDVMKTALICKWRDDGASEDVVADSLRKILPRIHATIARQTGAVWTEELEQWRLA